MSSAPYNGYSWKLREKIIPVSKHHRAAEGYQAPSRECDMCGDPECPPDSWHSEDYSEPYLFEPPATYLLCNVCHLRIHKRFNEPAENWHLYLEHLRVGGFGREFTSVHSLPARRKYASALKDQQPIHLPEIRSRAASDERWWEQLTLDPESLSAVWARPRPLRPRPPFEDFALAFTKVNASEVELQMLRVHAQSPRRSINMRTLAKCVLQSDAPSSANLAYGALAHRLWSALPTVWETDRRDDGSAIWLSLLAEGWKPEGREFEWVLIPDLVTMFR